MKNELTPDRIEAAVAEIDANPTMWGQGILSPNAAKTALAALEVVREWQDEKESLDQRMDAHAGRLITKCEAFIEFTKDYYRKRGEDWQEEADSWPLLCINDALLIIDALRAYQRQEGAEQ